MSEDFDIRDEADGTTDKDLERVLRPKSFEDFTGQKQVLDNLQIFVQIIVTCCILNIACLT